MPSVQLHRRDYCHTLLPVNDQDGKDEQSLYYCWITIPFSILINTVAFRIIDMPTLLKVGEYGSCTFWLESIKSKSTLYAYTTHLSLFCKFHNMNPDQLIQLNNSADNSRL